MNDSFICSWKITLHHVHHLHYQRVPWGLESLGLLFPTTTNKLGSATLTSRGSAELSPVGSGDWSCGMRATRLTNLPWVLDCRLTLCSFHLLYCFIAATLQVPTSTKDFTVTKLLFVDLMQKTLKYWRRQVHNMVSSCCIFQWQISGLGPAFNCGTKPCSNWGEPERALHNTSSVCMYVFVLWIHS